MPPSTLLKCGTAARAESLCLTLAICTTASATEPGPLTIESQGSLIAVGAFTQPGSFDPFLPMKPDG